MEEGDADLSDEAFWAVSAVDQQYKDAQAALHLGKISAGELQTIKDWAISRTASIRQKDTISSVFVGDGTFVGFVDTWLNPGETLEVGGDGPHDFILMRIHETCTDGALDGVLKAAAGGVVSNKWGAAGNPEHQKAVQACKSKAEEIARRLRAENPGIDFRVNDGSVSIGKCENTKGIRKFPDAWVSRVTRNEVGVIVKEEVVHVLEAARLSTWTGKIVVREILKQKWYKTRLIKSTVIIVGRIAKRIK